MYWDCVGKENLAALVAPYPRFSIKNNIRFLPQQEQYKMKTLRKTSALYTIIVAIIGIFVVASMASAKSLYVIANINASPTPIHTYDIQGGPDYVVFQAEQSITFRGGGGVGIAVDSDSATLFVTYEVSNIVQLLDATTFEDLGTTTAPGATNLSGIVVDQGKNRVYTIDRNTNNLYVYDWDASTNTLNLVTGGTGPGGSFVLAGVSLAYGIAFDEINDRLYVADQSSNTLRYFETTNFVESGNIVLTTHQPISVAIDQVRNFLYTGAIFNGDANLVKYDLNTSTETFVDINSVLDSSSEGVIGVAVDEDSGNVYATTGFSFDGLLVFDSSLNNLKVLSRTEIAGFETNWGDATGLAIPRDDISFNPLNFTATVDLSEASTGMDLTYDLCYDNAANTLAVNNVTITDSIPQGTSFASASDGGTQTAGVVTWNIGSLAAGAAQACVQLVLNVTATDGSTITNVATIDSDDTPPTTQSAVTNVVILPELGFSKTADVSLIANGENLTYELCYDNEANEGAVNNVVISDTLPAATSFVSASGGGIETSGVVSWDIGTLAAGAAEECVQVVVNVSATEESSITNTASIDSDETAPTTASAVTDIVVEVDYSFAGKGEAGAAGPITLFILLIATGGVLLMRSKKMKLQPAPTLAVAIVAVGLLMGTPIAHAQIYVGASGGATNAGYSKTDFVNNMPNFTLTNVSLDDTDNGWKVYGGYQFTSNLALEAAYVDLGAVNTEFDATIVPEDLQALLDDAAAIHPYMTSGIAIAGVGSIGLSQTVAIFGKVGIFDWDAEGYVKEISTGTLTDIDDSGTDAMYGVGIQFDINPQMSIRAEWEKYKADRNDVNFTSIGLQYRF